MMWPLLLRFLRSNAPYITLPFAAVIGVIGYNLESLLSDRYTPYNTIVQSTYPEDALLWGETRVVGDESIQDQRFERLEDEVLKDPTKVEKLKYQENVLGKNVSPSLQKD